MASSAMRHRGAAMAALVVARSYIGIEMKSEMCVWPLIDGLLRGHNLAVCARLNDRSVGMAYHLMVIARRGREKVRHGVRP